MDEFDILQIVGEGWFGKILLVEHKATDTEMVLKGSFKLCTISMGKILNASILIQRLFGNDFSVWVYSL